MSQENNTRVVQDLRSLASGPLKGVQRFKGYLANGFRFHIKELEGKRKNQNSGVMVKGETNSGEIEYYGILKEIISLQYLGGRRVVLFNCDWWDVHKKGKGIKIDKHGLISVNTRLKLRTNEPYVLLSQARQVFYVVDGNDPKWLVVVKTEPRHHYDMAKEKAQKDTEVFQQEETRNSNHDSSSLVLNDDMLCGRRFDIEEVIIPANESNQPKVSSSGEEIDLIETIVNEDITFTDSDGESDPDSDVEKDDSSSDNDSDDSII